MFKIKEKSHEKKLGLPYTFNLNKTNIVFDSHRRYYEVWSFHWGENISCSILGFDTM